MSLIASQLAVVAAGGGASVAAGHRRLPNSIALPVPRCRAAASHVARARKGGVSSRTRRLEDRSKKGGGGGVATPTAPPEADESAAAAEGEAMGFEVSTTPMPVLPGEEPDIWEGPQWNALGFVVQYLWAFGIVFALIACGIAVSTYNEGATDFRETPVYKESVQSQGLLEEPESSSTDVFEGNPTEVAPTLE